MTVGLIDYTNEQAGYNPNYNHYVKDVWNGKCIYVGWYLGEITRGGIKYRRYGFDQVATWPNTSNTALEILLPVSPGVEPLLSYISPGVVTLPYYDTVLFVHTRPDCNLTTLPAEIESYFQNIMPCPRFPSKTMFEAKGTPTIISLFITKKGVGSKIMAGQPDGKKFVWQGPYTCTHKPSAYSGEWSSPLDRIGYAFVLFTVPLDIITLPVQIPVGIMSYRMVEGLSDRH
jgi:hypothetical protein